MVPRNSSRRSASCIADAAEIVLCFPRVFPPRGPIRCVSSPSEQWKKKRKSRGWGENKKKEGSPVATPPATPPVARALSNLTKVCSSFVCLPRKTTSTWTVPQAKKSTRVTAWSSCRGFKYVTPPNFFRAACRGFKYVTPPNSFRAGLPFRGQLT